MLAAWGRIPRTWPPKGMPVVPFPPYASTTGFPDGSAGKESACNAGDKYSIPRLGRSLGDGNSYPLQYSGLENPMNYSPWGRKESDTPERLSLYLSLFVPTLAGDPVCPDTPGRADRLPGKADLPGAARAAAGSSVGETGRAETAGSFEGLATSFTNEAPDVRTDEGVGLETGRVPGSRQGSWDSRALGGAVLLASPLTASVPVQSVSRD